MRRALLASTLVTVLGGCLKLPGDGPAPQCKRTADCDDPAQVCQEGVCWGAPPPGPYAAQLGPPTSGGDLVATEIPDLVMPPDGWFGPVEIQAPVRVSGKIHLACPIAGYNACDASLGVAASITVSRPSRIPGGPLYLDLTSSTAATKSDSFAIGVPRIGADDAPYVLTITPADDAALPLDVRSPAELAPPIRVEVSAIDDVANLDIALGSGALRTIKGRVVDAVATPIAGIRISAAGRFDPARALERVSNIAVTGIDGAFTLSIPADALPVVDLVARPPKGATGPILRVHDLDAGQPTQLLPDLKMPASVAPQHFTVPVRGRDGSGAEIPIAGATVTVTTTLGDTSGTGNVDTTFESTATTDANGAATFDLIPGAITSLRSYQARVSAPPDSLFASIYDRQLLVGPHGGVLGQLDLPQRIAVSGILLASDGTPAAGVAMRATPSLPFEWSLDASQRALLDGLQAPTAVTAENGAFLLWVDPDVGGVIASYDIACEPAAGALLPRWTIPSVTVIDHDMPVGIGMFALPAAKYVHGKVVDPHGAAVENAEVRLLEVPVDSALCAARNAPSDCVVPATVTAIDRSDASGIVRLVLPDLR